jgi:signal transduction histidine kinase/ligand-binding sensor domain-containing protein
MTPSTRLPRAPGPRSRGILLIAFLSVLCLGPASILRAQPANIAFSYLTQRDGLSTYRVTSIVQDRRGFLWIGTPGGLNRYDGYAVSVFKHDPKDDGSISDDAIECLLTDRDGTLWIGTAEGGLDRFDDRTMRFTSYKSELGNRNTLSDNRIRCLFEDSKGVLWVGTYTGLNVFDKARNQFRQYRSVPGDATTLNSPNITCITEDAGGTVWIGTAGGGLHSFDRATGKFKRFTRSSGAISEDYITRIYADQNGALWIGTLSGVLNRFDSRNGGVTRLPLAEIKSSSLLSDNAITAIEEDAGGILWIGVTGNGLIAHNKKTGTIQRYRNNPATPQTLSNNDVTCLFQDAGNILWVGTGGGGCNAFRNKYRLFEQVSVRQNVTSLCQDRSGTVFVGTGKSGLFRYDPSTLTIRHELDVNDKGKGQNSINALDVDEDGNLCIGTESGLLVYNTRTQTTNRHRANIDDASMLNNDAIKTVVYGRSGIFWVGTQKGLHSFDHATGIFKRYPLKGGDTNGSSEPEITTLFEDTRQRLWIGTSEDGLFLFEPGKNIRRYQHDEKRRTSISSNYIFVVNQAPDGTIWIGTGAGMNTLDEAQQTFIQYDIQDGLPSNVIYGILPDTLSHIWISTSEGLCYLTPHTHQEGGRGRVLDTNITVQKFDMSDGLQGRVFARGACLNARGGQMYFGGENGFNVFRPEQILRRRMVPSVIVTDFQIKDRDRFITQHPAQKGSILGQAIYSTQRIVLPYNRNSFAFEFAVLSFADPDKNVIKYKLDGGAYKDWITTSTRDGRRREFNDLAPGDYVLYVTGSDAEGNWNNNGTTLYITVTPPWWMTWWARVLYGLIAISLIFAIIYAQRVRVIRKERQKSEMREAELRAQAAEAQNRALQAENQRQESELAKAKELEKAYSDLETSHRHLQETQQQLVHSEKMASLGQLTAGIAHEIKNPLNFVNNFSVLSLGLIKELEEEFTASKDKSVGEMQSYIDDILADLKMNAEKINHHGKRADSIVRAMLLHSRAESGERQATEINTLLEESVNLAYHSSRANNVNMNVQFETDLDPKAGSLKIVPQEIMRVFLNIIQNAIHAVSENMTASGPDFVPTVWIRSVRHEHQMEITIRDNGKGIPPEGQAKVFEPFYTTKPTGQGTGLGLSISYDIVVKGHQGDLSVRSEPGQGATFIITLPIQ